MSNRFWRWADAFHAQHGKWPQPKAGAIPAALGETWGTVDYALVHGTKGLPGGFSLAELLAVERDLRNRHSRPPLTRKQILRWADAHFLQTGKWPTQFSGPIRDAPEESWAAVNTILMRGGRGLPGGSSLARLLAKYRGKRNRADLPPLSRKRIRAWAGSHFQRTGTWPTRASGAVTDAMGEMWKAIDSALRRGHRGLPGGSSLREQVGKARMPKS